MQCPNCHEKFHANKITNQQTEKGFLSQFTCPHCATALTLSVKLYVMTALGFVVLLLGSLLAMFHAAPDNIIYSAVGFVGALIAFLSSLLNKPRIQR